MCIDCEYMACRILFVKVGKWEGCCINPHSEKYRQTVFEDGFCNLLPFDQELYKRDKNGKTKT